MFRNKTQHSVTEPFIDLMATLCIVLFLVLMATLVFLLIKNEANSMLTVQNKQLQQDKKNLEDQLGNPDKLQKTIEDQKTQIQALQNNLDSVSKQQKDLIASVNQIITNRETLCQTITDKINSDPSLGKDTAERVGTKIIIHTDSLFASGSFQLTAIGETQAKAIGNKLREVLDENINSSDATVKIAYIEVCGNTDNVGSSNADPKPWRLNDNLGAERAYNYVSTMLGEISNSNASKRYFYGKYFRVASMSMYQPVAGTVFNQSNKDRSKNRRIEITIIFTENDFSNLIDKYASQTTNGQ